jgi:hypothetical protein
MVIYTELPVAVRTRPASFFDRVRGLGFCFDFGLGLGFCVSRLEKKNVTVG